MAICLLLFLPVSPLLSRRVGRSVNQVCEVYMASMNTQLRQKFSLTIELAQEKADGVINRTPPAESSYDRAMLAALRTSAQVRSFVCLGFLRDNGSLMTICGEDTVINDSESGLELDHAENGKIRVDMFRASRPGHYNGILMDARMPAMDGYEAARQLRALDRPDRYLPIITMTANSFSEDVRKSMERGMDHHPSKPLDFRERVNELQRCLKYKHILWNEAEAQAPASFRSTTGGNTCAC